MYEFYQNLFEDNSKFFSDLKFGVKNMLLNDVSAGNIKYNENSYVPHALRNFASETVNDYFLPKKKNSLSVQ